MNNIIVYISIFLSINIYAQQVPQLTQYLYNTVFINPAYAGSREALAITSSTRNQWVGIENAPKTSILSIHSPFFNQNIGVGISSIIDDYDYEKQGALYVDFSYTLKLSSEAKMSLGLKGGTYYYKINQVITDTDSSIDPYFNQKLSNWNPSVGTGIYFHSNKWFLGLSIPNFIFQDIKENDNAIRI